MLTLADITDESGKYIELWALSGSSVATIHMGWPNQERPSESSWVLWCRFQKKAHAPSTPKSHRLNKPMALADPLGDWLTTSPYTA
eukprot:12827788-Ditylum_brightwellii.AAC.1